MLWAGEMGLKRFPTAEFLPSSAIYTQFGRPGISDRAREDQKAFLGISLYLAVPGIAVSGVCALQSCNHLVLGEQWLWETG